MFKRRGVGWGGARWSTKPSLHSRTLGDVTLLGGRALVCRALIRGWQEPLTPSRVLFNPCAAAEEQRDQREERRRSLTHSDDVVEPPHVPDGAAEVQAVEGLTQRAISVAL